MQYHCECDPHGDNAKCDRPCAKSAMKQAEDAARIVRTARYQRLFNEARGALRALSDEAVTHGDMYVSREVHPLIEELRRLEQIAFLRDYDDR